MLNSKSASVSRLHTLWLLLASLSTVGCTESLRVGASAIFVQSTVCPATRVKVTPRPDISPHTIYAVGPPPAAPPPEVAADPERMRLWNSQQPKRLDIDAIAKTFEVSGCGRTIRYVCGHPRIDGRDGPFSVEASVNAFDGTMDLTFHAGNHADDNFQTIAGEEVASSVVCMPADVASPGAAR